jgi:hypothetical protein
MEEVEALGGGDAGAQAPHGARPISPGRGNSGKPRHTVKCVKFPRGEILPEARRRGAFVTFACTRSAFDVWEVSLVAATIRPLVEAGVDAVALAPHDGANPGEIRLA